MDLSGIVVRDADDRVGSLTLALDALLRWAGANVRYRSLNASLGLSLRTTAVRRPTCLGFWTTYGSDVFLRETAQSFGLRLRELHPPQAAAALDVHEPFAQHFEASYAPLIHRALEHGQPVVAWQGWPDVRKSLWGVITHATGEGLGFAGTTMWSHGKPVTITSPPVQLYVVEDVSPCGPSEEDLLRAATMRLRQAAHDEVQSDPEVVTGGAAYDEWLTRLQSVDLCPTCGDRGGRCHLQHARFLSSHRSAGARFFRHYRDGAGSKSQPLLHALVTECRGAIDALATSRDPSAVDVLVKTAEGRAALTAGVQAARSFDGAIIDAIDHLADALA